MIYKKFFFTLSHKSIKTNFFLWLTRDKNELEYA